MASSAYSLASRRSRPESPSRPLGACTEISRPARRFRFASAGSNYELSWPEGVLVEVRVGVCSAACEERVLADPTSEFSEPVPMPEFDRLLWHARSEAGVTAPLSLGSGTLDEIVPYTAPTPSDGVVGVWIVTEQPRGDDVLTRFGAARLSN